MKLLLLVFFTLPLHAMQHNDYVALLDDAHNGTLAYEKIIPLLSPEDQEAIVRYSSLSSSPEEITQLRRKKAGTFFDHVVGSSEAEPIGNVLNHVTTHCMISPDGNYSIFDRKAIHNWNIGSTVFIRDPESVDQSCTIKKNRLMQCSKKRYGRKIDTQENIYGYRFLSVWDLATGNRLVDTLKIADGFEPTFNETGVFCIAFVDGMLSAIPLNHSTSQENTSAITKVYPDNPHNFKMREMWPNGPGCAISTDDKCVVMSKAPENSASSCEIPQLIIFAIKKGPFEFKTLIAGECCGFSDDSSLLAASNGRFIRTYETEKFTQLMTFQFDNYLHTFRFSHDNQRLLCEGQQGYCNSFYEWKIQDKCSYVYDLGQKELLWRSSYSQPVVVSHDMQWVAEQNLGSVWIKNLANLEDWFPIAGKKRPLLIDPTNHYLITTSSTDPETHVELRNAKTGGLIAHLTHDKKNGGLPAFTRDSRGLVTYSAGKGNHFKLFPIDHDQLTSEQKMAFFLMHYFLRTKTALFPALVSKILATTTHGDLNFGTELHERAIAVGAQAGDMQSVHTILEHGKKYPLMRLHDNKNTFFSVLPGDVIRMVKHYWSPAHHKKAIELLDKVIATEKDHDKKDMLYKILAMLKRT